MTEREQFEAWAKVRYAKNPHFWLRQIDDGGYSCGMADSAWAAWQAARAQPTQVVPATRDPFLRERQQLEQEWSELRRLQAQYKQVVRAKMGVAVPMTSEDRPATGERIASQLRVEEVGAALIRRARDIVVGHQRGSISLVQRHLRISYNTAAKLLEALEQQGVVSPQRQNGQREVLVLPDISGIVGEKGGA